MRKLLLASTALVGASMLAAPAMAGTPSVGDDFSVSIGGNLRFSVLIYDQDLSEGRGRGYKFQSDESEVKFSAEATADNGLNYGFQLEVNTQTDDQDAADETWMFIDGGDAWGRVELGDQDDAGDRMFVAGEDVMAGRGGFDGAVGNAFKFDKAVSGPSLSPSSDATKIIYFTPRFAGLQLGASWTPDNGQKGGQDLKKQPDNNGDFENVYSLGVNFQNTFNGTGITVAAVYFGGDGEPDTSGGANTGTTVEDLERWGVGGQVTFAGFDFAVGYVDLGEGGITEPTNDADNGSWWDVAVRYTTGPWKVGVGYFSSEKDFGTTAACLCDSEVDILSIGFNYAVAPGWAIASDINFVEAENINAAGDDNDGTVFVISSTMSF